MVLSENQRRANNAALTATGVAALSLLPVAAYQLGLLRHLPDPQGRFFSSDEITSSKAAHPFGIPDSLLGLASYATTFALLLAVRKLEFARPLLRVKLAADGSAAAVNSVRQVLTFRKLCSYCTGTALATAAVVHFGRKSIR